MAEQQRVPLPGSDKQPVVDAEPIGDPHPEERLEVTVEVRPRPGHDLAARVDGLAAGTAALGREAFAERFGADAPDVGRVEAFARANGLAVVHTSRARRSVVLSGSVGRLSAAFGVSLAAYAHPDGGTFRGRRGPVYVPSDLADVIQGVFGLDDRPAARPRPWSAPRRRRRPRTDLTAAGAALHAGPGQRRPSAVRRSGR